MIIIITITTQKWRNRVKFLKLSSSTNGKSFSASHSINRAANSTSYSAYAFKSTGYNHPNTNDYVIFTSPNTNANSKMSVNDLC